MIACLLCNRRVPRWTHSSVSYAVAHVTPEGHPCPYHGSWHRRRIDECRIAQRVGLDRLLEGLPA